MRRALQVNPGVRWAVPMNELSLDLAVAREDAKDLEVVCEAHVDGVSLANPKQYSIALSDLRASADAPGSYFLITCSCGDAGCAGIESPVKVMHETGTVTWEIVEPKPERAFKFEESAYRATVREASSLLAERTAALAGSSMKRIVAPLGEEDFFLGKNHRAI